MSGTPDGLVTCEESNLEHACRQVKGAIFSAVESRSRRLDSAVESRDADDKERDDKAGRDCKHGSRG